MVQDILNFEEFVKYLTNEEQKQLLEYLPPLDTAKLPGRYLFFPPLLSTGGNWEVTSF